MSGYGTRPTRGLLDTETNRQALVDALMGVPRRVGNAFTGMAQQGLLANERFMQGEGADQPFLPSMDSGGRVGALASFLSSNMAMGGPAGSLGAGPSMARKASALPMDEASRMRRAKEMGFDTSRPVYHGTDTNFRSFDPDRAIGTQFWSTTDKAAIEAGEVGAAGRGVIKELYHRIKNPAGWNEYDKFSTDELIARGYDGLALPDPNGHVTYVAFEPNQYRDVRARFDPAKKDSRNLMSGYANPSPAFLYGEPQE